MIDFKVLSRRDILSLCGRTQELCIRQFERIAERSDASDLALRALLEDLIARSRSQALAIEEYVAGSPDLPQDSSQPSSSRSGGHQGEELLREYLTSPSRSLGEGPLLRDFAMFFAESLEEEAARFYRTLAEHAPDWESRQFLLDLSQDEGSALRHLREVVLQG